MEVIIFAVVAGLGIGYFATQNTNLISIYFGTFSIPNIPLYLVVIGAMLLGLLLSWILSLVKSFSSQMTLHGKENQIKEDEKNITELTKEVHQLQLENARLKMRLGEGDTDEKSL